MTEAKLTIGHIAHAAGVNVETVRYYQRRGLVSLPPKRTRGFRYYTPETASRVRFIKRAQALGMSLKEVQPLIKIDAKGACKETRALAVAHRIRKRQFAFGRGGPRPFPSLKHPGSCAWTLPSDCAQAPSCARRRS